MSTLHSLADVRVTAKQNEDPSVITEPTVHQEDNPSQDASHDALIPH